MKKHLSIFLSVSLSLLLLAGCGKKQNMLPTVPSSLPETTTLPADTVPRETAATFPRETVSPTIEDGNGPIPSQDLSRMH